MAREIVMYLEDLPQLLNQEAMCRSYMATRDEKDTTRCSKPCIREFLTLDKKKNAFDHPEIRSNGHLFVLQKAVLRVPIECGLASMIGRVFFINTRKRMGSAGDSRAFAYINELKSIGLIVPGIANFF